MKTKKVILIILGLFLTSGVLAQELGDTFWTSTNDSDCVVRFEKKNDLNYYDVLNRDVVDTLWTSTYGGTGNENGNSVHQTADGGYIIVGRTTSFGAGSGDVWLIKTSSSGDTVWTRTFGGTDYETGSDVKQTGDGGYIITGQICYPDNDDADVWLIKTDALGDTLWTKAFGGPDVEWGFSVDTTSDSGYIIAGFTKSYGAGFNDMWLIKTDSSGDTLWTKTFGGTDWEYAYCVQQTTDDGYIVVGFTKSFGAGDRDVWLIKTDSNGNEQWNQTFGGTHMDFGMYVQQTTGGGYIITGMTKPYGAQGGSNLYLIKTDESGNTIWIKTFGGAVWDSGIGYCVKQVTDGGYIVAGWLDTDDGIANNGDVWLIKTNPSGEALWTKTINGNGNGDYSYDLSRSIQQTTDGGYIITGVTGLHDGDQDVWLIKTSEDPAPGSISGMVNLNGGTGNVDDVLITAEPGTYQTNPTGGNYTLVVLEGDYNVTASLEGYISQTFENVHVDLGQVTILDITLEAVDIDITPDSFYFETTGTASDVMNLQNQCTINLDYQILIDFEDQDEIHYDGENDNAFGLYDGGTFITAVRFTSEELANYYGSYNLTGIKIFINDDSFSNITLKVWEGGSFGDPGVEIYSEDITTEILVGDWKNHMLTTSAPLISDNEYWIGYSVEHTSGGYPVGLDAGPMVAGKGGWIYFMGQWFETVNVGLDYNVNIRAIVSQMWLACDPTSGTIPANGNTDVDVMIDATDLTNGDYFADIIVKILPDLATYIVPVHLNKTLTLNPPQNLFVTEEGYATWDAPGGGPQTIQVDPQSIPYYTGTCTSTSFTDSSEVRAHYLEDGWMMFDISAIPAGATITEIEFHGFINDNSWPYWQINGVDINPLTASAGDLYPNLQFPQYNFFQESGDLPIDWRVEILGGDANIHMEASLSQGWFCIGIYSTDNSPDYYIEFDGWNKANPPYLMVDYETDDGIITKTRVDLKSKASENRDLLGYNVYLDSVFVEYTTDLFYQYTGLTNGQSYIAGVSALYDEGESNIIEELFYYYQPQEYFDISGNISYFSNDAPIPNADVDLTGNDTFTATTNTSGNYLFNDIPGGDYISTPFKDDDIGGLSGLDASRIARFSAGLYTLNCLEMIAGDVSMNGDISGLDASRVARYAVGSITELNDDGIEWVFTPEPITECADWPPIVYESAREYTPLDSDLTDEDFIGIRLGDVSGNWSPVVREPLTYDASEITNIETGINSTLRIPIVIEEATAIEGIDISIEFNPEVLQLTELSLNEGILDNKDYVIETNLEEAGQGIIVIYAQRDLVSESGIVAFIDFDVIGAVGSKSEIYFTRFDVNETEASGGLQAVDSEDDEIVTRRLEVNVVQTLPKKFALYQNYPNPFNSKTLISYDLPKDTYVNIQIYNVRGQLVEELVNGVETAGRKQIEWNAKDRNSGIYFYRLSTEDKTIIKKMLLLH